MEPKKYSIFFDTNFLGHYSSEGNDKSLVVNNFRYLELVETFVDNTLGFIKKYALNDSIKIIIPRICIEELKSQQLRAYENNLNKLMSVYRKFSRTVGFRLEYSSVEEYKDALIEKTDYFFSLHDREISILEYPPNDLLPNIIERSLNKKPPIGESKKNSFKDELIWQSILKYAEENKNDEFILCSNDNVFGALSLQEEFHERTGKKLHIIKRNDAELQGMLEETLRLNPSILKVRSRILDSDFLERISDFLDKQFTRIENNTIHSFKIGKDALNIRRENGKYELSLLVMITHEDPFPCNEITSNSYIDHCTIHNVYLTIEIEEDGSIYLCNVNFGSVPIEGNHDFGRVKVL